MRKVTAGIIGLLIIATVLSANVLASRDNGNSDEHRKLLSSTLIGVPAGMTGATGAIGGVNAGGAPWVVAEGRVMLRSDGRLQAEVEGLLITGTGTAFDGTTGPVTGVRASLVCQGTNVVASTGVVPLDKSGDAEIKQVISLPSSCIGPIVLIRVGATTSNPGPLMGPWIAASGF